MFEPYQTLWEMEWLCPEIVRAAEIALTAKKWSRWSHKNQLHLLQLRLHPFYKEPEPTQTGPKKSLTFEFDVGSAC